MMERIYFLKDLSEDCVDAIIIATKSTKEEIESAIINAKKLDEYTWEDLLEALPSDCEVYDRWNSEFVYY